ncbi:MAG TPA: RNA polymerase sigma factor [Polyangia bacterium]
MDRAPSPPPADPGRLEQMFRTHRGVVWRLLRARGLAPDAAADATQEVFLVAAQRLADIEAGKERAFLIGTALRVARATRRTRARLQLEDDLDVVNENETTLDEKRSALDMIGKVLSRVDPMLVDAFLLFEIAEFSGVEIAELLGVPPGTVASRVRRAREAFREATQRIERKLRREQGEVEDKEDEESKEGSS